MQDETKKRRPLADSGAVKPKKKAVEPDSDESGGPSDGDGDESEQPKGKSKGKKHRPFRDWEGDANFKISDS